MRNLFHSKHFLLLLVSLLAPMTVCASYDFQVDGLYYSVAWEKATVTSGDVKYKGDVTIPATVSHNGQTYTVCRIDNDAFYKCGELTSVTINGVIEWIGNRAFCECKQLRSINLPDGLLEIWAYAFANCESLKHISIPSSVRKIEENVFWNCKALETVEFGDATTDGDMLIGSSIFNGNVHEGCPSLRSVTYGKCVSSIGTSCFAYVGSLSSIVSYRVEPPKVAESTFKDYLNFALTDSIYENTTLYVPAEALPLYQAHDVWKKFYHIKPLGELTISIKYADNGVVKLRAEKGRSYEFVIEPADGWTVHTVTYNDEDVTSQLSAGGVFTTPVITESGILNVAFEKSASAVKSLSGSSQAKVTVIGGQLTVEHATEGELISVYTVDGKCVGTVTATGGTTSFPLTETNQVYIVKAGDKEVKIAF